MSTKAATIKLRVSTAEKEALAIHGSLSGYIRSCVPELHAAQTDGQIGASDSSTTSEEPKSEAGSQSARPRAKHAGTLYERIAARTRELVETEGVSNAAAEQIARREEGIAR